MIAACVIVGVYLYGLDQIFTRLVADLIDLQKTDGKTMFRWYVINTYSGHENKVKANLEHRVKSMNQELPCVAWSCRPSPWSRPRTDRRCRPSGGCGPATCW